MRMFSPANVLANNRIIELFFDIRVNDLADKWEARCKVNGCTWGYAVISANTLMSPSVTPPEVVSVCVRHVVDDHEADYEQFKTPPAHNIRMTYRGKPVPDFMSLSNLDGWVLSTSDGKYMLGHQCCGYFTAKHGDVYFKYMVLEAIQHVVEGCKG